MFIQNGLPDLNALSSVTTAAVGAADLRCPSPTPAPALSSCPTLPYSLLTMVVHCQQRMYNGGILSINFGSVLL